MLSNSAAEPGRALPSVCISILMRCIQKPELGGVYTWTSIESPAEALMSCKRDTDSVNLQNFLSGQKHRAR